MQLNVLVLCVVTAAIAAGCTTSKPGNAAKADLAKGTRAIIGTELIGTRGATPRDQDNIDDTVAGACAVGVYGPEECERHNALTETNPG